MIERELENLKNLLEKEKKLLLKGVKGKAEAAEIERLESQKLKLLKSLSRRDPEDFKNHLHTVKEIQVLNREVEKLILNNLKFLESLLEELFPQRGTTYGSKEQQSLFQNKA